MRMRFVGSVGAAAILMAAAQASAADAKAGKTLHDASCGKCHGTEVYTRKDRKIRSLDALKTTVDRCAKAAQADWTTAQKADVVEYLNEDFFHFSER